ncbi:MAG: GNAT family N-acetyltransferase [Actinomycetota bacterium]|nr:GNAT family N-acetyltransferase [Actinomycetota bacterium]
MRAERYKSTAPIAQEWDDLADRVHAVPWVRPGWIDAWWRAFGKGRTEIVALRRDDRLAGVAAFARRNGALVSPTNWHTPEFGLLAEDDQAMSELVASLWISSPRSIHLSFLYPRRAEVAECRAAARARGYRTIERVVLRSPYVRIEGDWDDHLARLDRHMLREISRCRRRLEEMGEVSFELVDGTEDLDRFLEEGFQIEDSGWKESHGTAIAAVPEVRQFYSEVAHWATSRGILRLAFLRLDRRPIAFDFNIEDDGVCYALKGGYDDAYRKFGPGMMLTQEMLKYAFVKRLRRYDFAGDVEGFKTEWTQSHNDRVRLQAFAPSPPGLLEYAAFAYGRRLVKPVVNRLRTRYLNNSRFPLPSR